MPEAAGKMCRVRSETDAQVSVHLEVIAGDDEHAGFVSQPLDEARRVDGVVITDEGDGAGLGRHVRCERRALVSQPRRIG